jgi:multidrug resistance protein, MATE family
VDRSGSPESREGKPKGDLARQVRRLALPAIVHSLLQTLVFVVDRVMLGRHGEASLAAMQIGGTLEWSIWSVFAAFEVGTIARVGRHVGAGNRVAARRVAWLSLSLAAGIGIVVALATPLVLALLPRLTASDPHATMRASESVLSEARGYLGITIAASPLVFIAATSIATLQAGGDTRTPLAIGVASNIVHVALNRVLILGAFGVVPAMGARGAGISTAFTFLIEAALATAALTSRARPVSLRADVEPSSDEPKADKDRGADIRAEARELVRVGAPALAERVLYHVGFITYAMVVTRLGDAAMAANQSLISIESICFLSADGFGVAAAALVAQKLGAGQPEEAHRTAKVATRYAVITLTAFGVGSFLLKDLILPLFSDDPTVIAIGRRTMFVLVVAQPFMATGMVLAQSLRGAARTRAALVVSLIGAVFVRLTATWLFVMGAGLGLVGVWMGSTTDWFVRSVVLSIMFRRPPTVRPAPPRTE